MYSTTPQRDMTEILRRRDCTRTASNANKNIAPALQVGIVRVGLYSGARAQIRVSKRYDERHYGVDIHLEICDNTFWNLTRT